MAWVLQTQQGEEDVVTALADHSYTYLCVGLQFGVSVPVVPLWDDRTHNTLAILTPASLAPWLEAELTVVADPFDRDSESASGFAVAVVAIVAIAHYYRLGHRDNATVGGHHCPRDWVM